MENKKRRVVVTGIGIIVSNGNNKDEFYNSLVNGKTGLKKVDLFDTKDLRTNIAGEVSIKFSELKKNDDLERTIFLAYKASEEALKDSKLSRNDIYDLCERAGISFSTSLGDNLRMMEFIRNRLYKKENSPNLLIEVPNYITYISKHLGVRGPSYTTNSACAAGTAGAGLAYDSIRYGRTDLMIVGGADPLTKFSMSGFNSLKSTSINGCKPFDKNRDGMSLGEGSAFMIFELLERALNRSAHIYGEILGYGLGNDAYHITSPDPEGSGAYYAMKTALTDSGLKPENIDYINAHGTATIANDSMEIRAIKRLFNNCNVAISSTKSMTGHCLGAAGSIELAACLLAIDKGFLPPTSSLEEIDNDFSGFNFIKGKGIKATINYAMSNSFAFAGNTASILLGKFNR